MPRELAQARREAKHHYAKPPKVGLVLEVGSGGTPHPRSNLAVEKYVADDFERTGAYSALDLSRPLVVADGQRLPFADRSFAYTIASHVLEHAPDPKAFVDELTRVSPAGFVQIPTREAELTFGWPFHPWLINREGDTLVFSPKGDLGPPCGEILHEGFAESVLFRVWFGAHRSRWHHSIEWRERLLIKVDGRSAADRKAEVDTDRTIALLKDLQERKALQPLGDALRAVLRCPMCRGVLALRGERAACLACGRAYPAVGDVPILLEEAAH